MALRVRLDRKIEVLASSTIIENGESVTTYTHLFYTWAERKDLTDKQGEEVEAMTVSSNTYTNWIIAYPPDNLMPDTKMKVKELATNAEYDIENISEPEKSVKEYLVLRCKQKQQR
ncbi:phage head closure protein [Emticicia fontis]